MKKGKSGSKFFKGIHLKLELEIFSKLLQNLTAEVLTKRVVIVTVLYRSPNLENCKFFDALINHKIYSIFTGKTNLEKLTFFNWRF